MTSPLFRFGRSLGASALVTLFLVAGSGCAGCDDPEHNDQTNQVNQDDRDVYGDDVDETPIALRLTSIAPIEGPAAGNTTVTLSGEGFAEGMRVFFGEEEALSVSRYSSMSGEAVTPPSDDTGAVDVTVENPDGERYTLENAFTYFAATETPRVVEYCQLQHQSSAAEPLLVEVDAPFELYAYVFVEGLTEGEGQGQDIQAQIGVGESVATLNWQDMSYHGDLEGITPGELANDEYVATVTLSEPGDHVYLARFRGPADEDWVVCGLNGPVEEEPELEDFGHIEVALGLFPRPENCGIQFPLIAQAVETGDDITVYGRVFEPGITDQADLPAELVAEVLFGPAGAHPIADAVAFDVVSATRNPQYVDEDFEEFEATVSFDQGGDHAFVYRFSLDSGANWTYCDISGLRTEEQVNPDRFGAIVVASYPNPVIIDFCHTYGGDFQGTTDADGPTITMEVYEAGVTTLPDSSALLEVEGGFGPVGSNPVFAYQWTPLSFDGPVQGNPNNHEFSGPVYEEANAPTPGTYQALTRVRLVGDFVWTYCNTYTGEPNFFVNLTKELTVTP